MSVSWCVFLILLTSKSSIERSGWQKCAATGFSVFSVLMCEQFLMQLGGLQYLVKMRSAWLQGYFASLVKVEQWLTKYKTSWYRVLRSRIHYIEKFSAHANSSSLDWRQHSTPSVCSTISLIQLQWVIPCRLLLFSYFRPKSGVSPVLNTDTEWLTWIWLMVSCRIPCWQSCQLSRILRETHAFLHNLTLTHIITSISRTKHLHVPLYGTESGRGNQRHNSRATKDRDSAVDDCVEGPSAMIKQKIKDSGSLRKWSGVAIIVYIGRIAARAKYDCHYILWMFLFHCLSQWKSHNILFP